MKTIYFIRHGQSEDNEADVFSSESTPLTKTGRAEARSIQGRCQPLELEAIVTSDCLRARQTAEEISSTADVDIVDNRAFREISHPDELTGQPHDDPEMRQILEEIRANQADPDYHYSNEENIYDFRDRLAGGLAELVHRPEETILVVTHSYALVVIAAIILCDSTVDHQTIENFNTRLSVTNTGITVTHLDAENDWRLATWNNVTHLHT